MIEFIYRPIFIYERDLLIAEEQCLDLDNENIMDIVNVIVINDEAEDEFKMFHFGYTKSKQHKYARMIANELYDCNDNTVIKIE